MSNFVDNAILYLISLMPEDNPEEYEDPMVNIGKNEILDLFSELLNDHGKILDDYNAYDARYLAVTTQSLFEEAIAISLSTHHTIEARCVIQTPTPPTPLKVAVGKDPVDFMTPDILDSYKLRGTVVFRQGTLRDLIKSGAETYCIYDAKNILPEGHVYYEMTEYPNFYDYPIDDFIEGTSMSEYLWKDESGVDYYFMVQAPQINAPLNNQHFAVFYGPYEMMV